nr:synaptobrevin, longin-like domain protein [Tanacetum cinerariifolium]
MIAILEKTDHNIDFHQIVDFIEASHIRYALTINPTVYVSHIRQFWSTARIKTMNKETKILADVYGNPRTISESSLMRHLKLNNAEGISSLPNTKLVENLSLIGYNILPNQRFTFQKGQFSHQWKFLIHTIMQCLSPKSTSFNEFSSNIATVVVCLATNRVYNFSKMIFDGMVRNVNNEHVSLLRDDSQREAFPTVTSLDAGQDKENIIKTSSLPHESSPRVTSLDANERNLEISGLKARVKILEDKDRGREEPAQEDAPIKGGSMEIGEEVGLERSTKLGSNDTEEMVNILTSMEAANILTSGVAVVSVSPVAAATTVGVPTVNGLVPTVSTIFTTASVVTPYSRRPREISVKDKGNEKVVESDVPKKKKLQEQIDAQVAREIEEEFARDNQRLSKQLARDSEIARLHAEEELKMMIKGLDRSNKMIAKHLHEYEQAAADLSIGEKIELINELQIEDFVHMSSKEEGEIMKRKGLKLDQKSAKKIKTSEDVSEEDLKGMMQLVPVEEKIIRLGGYTEVYQFFVDMLKQFDREDLHQLWALVKETLSIRQATKDKEKELWVELKRLFEPDFEDQLWTHTQNLMHDPLDWKLYDTCGVHHVSTKDQEIFMLVERDYPLRRGLAIVMICNKLQAEEFALLDEDKDYSQ